MRATFVALLTLSIGALSAVATNCSSKQFWYETKSCCLEHGGPPSNYTPSPPHGRQCPDKWYWHAGKTCCVPRHPDGPSEPTCPPKCSWNRGDQSCHEGGTTTSSSGPQPSHRPQHNHRKAKRAVSACPTGLQACSIADENGELTNYECTNPMEDLNTCGGCVDGPNARGADCTAIPNAWNVGCAVGVCQVYTCAPGYKVSVDGRSCRAL